ncbi:hypothetical protein DFA_12250 [Cavenderia fasciculata]|uniref:Enoyl reductase (ER) domain-containing protein n=1 Tax=Cavenderia fasciculata TaxID=261658 RepID=F4QCV3_CACFS|nr:uncharacterized protein DFA_12250 [Cavenderia fasciculata]EGG14477.1 hypothetical protein DFA_12250 [Cavenderia fasciculata]|eukprot:XP_004353886.1 hypothetical protein DFA_12250 [Cavenderia fasciculata]
MTKVSFQEFIQNNQNITTQLYQLLNPNGQLFVINNDSVVVDENSKELIIRDIKSTQLKIQHINNNNSTLDHEDITMICKKASIEETNFDNIDNILFITPSSSSKLSTRLISQASSISKHVKEGEKVVIIYLESLIEMNSSNLDKKSMQLIRLHQILRKEQLPVKLITLITGQLNQCLVPICRDYDRPSDMFEHLIRYQSAWIIKVNIKLECNDQVIQVPKHWNWVQDALLMINKILESIQAKAASVNFKDLMTLEGRVDQKRNILGQDLAGIVTRIGSKVTNFKIGDEVFGLSHAFTYSVALENNLVHKPKELSFVEAASLPVTMGTAYTVLKKASIVSSDSILIHSATGGVEHKQHIRTRKHIGKVVIDYENAERDLVEPLLRERDRKQIERVHYQLDGVQDTLLITGQTGVAVESLHYIIKHAPQLRDTICYNDSTIKPVKSVIHCANTYVFADADDVTMENHRQAMMAKAIGALNLHNLFKELQWKLNHFHLLSSIAQYSGRESFSYAVANSFLDHLAQHRRNCGLTATAIIWGSIGSTGRVAISKTIK